MLVKAGAIYKIYGRFMVIMRGVLIFFFSYSSIRTKITDYFEEILGRYILFFKVILISIA
jgi:hypothetical protein